MNDQQLKVFLEYTRRFEEISALLPTFQRLNETTGITNTKKDGSSDTGDPDLMDKFMLRYLNISSEEWYLHEKNLITEEVWAMWRHYIVTTLTGSEKFSDFWWNKCRKNFLKSDGTPTTFVTFVDETVPEQDKVTKSKYAHGHTIKTDSEG
jgi:hypothetical protein